MNAREPGKGEPPCQPRFSHSIPIARFRPAITRRSRCVAGFCKCDPEPLRQPRAYNRSEETLEFPWNGAMAGNSCSRRSPHSDWYLGMSLAQNGARSSVDAAFMESLLIITGSMGAGKTMEQRVRTSESGIARTGYIARVAELNGILDRARLENFTGNSENRSVPELAREMFTRVSWISDSTRPRARLPVQRPTENATDPGVFPAQFG